MWLRVFKVLTIKKKFQDAVHKSVKFWFVYKLKILGWHWPSGFEFVCSLVSPSLSLCSLRQCSQLLLSSPSPIVEVNSAVHAQSQKALMWERGAQILSHILYSIVLWGLRFPPGPAARSFLTATTSTWPCLPCVSFRHLCELPSPEKAAVLQPDINNPSSNSGSGCPVFLASVGAWGFTWFKLQKSFLDKEWVGALECLKFLYFLFIYLFLQI